MCRLLSARVEEKFLGTWIVDKMGPDYRKPRSHIRAFIFVQAEKEQEGERRMRSEGERQVGVKKAEKKSLKRSEVAGGEVGRDLITSSGSRQAGWSR